MGRVYQRIYSDVAFAAGIKSSQPSITITAGNMRLVRLKVGSEGRLTQLAVVQESTDSGLVNFTVDVLKSLIPYPFPDEDFATATLPNDVLDLYKILPTITVSTPGNVGSLDDDEPGYAYKNMDGSWTMNQQFIYVLIKPTSAVTDTHWRLSVTVEPAVIGSR